MSGKSISIEELLKEQDNPQLLATVEAVDGKDDTVKVTPWTRAAGCLCHLAINIKKTSLEGASPTGDIHVCCGKNLKVVELYFKKNETIGLNELFQQMHAKANTARPAEDHSNHSSSAYSHPSQFQSHLPSATDRFSVDEPECFTKYAVCISNPPPGYDYKSWVCECRNLYRICTRTGALEFCPAPRY